MCRVVGGGRGLQWMWLDWESIVFMVVCQSPV